MDNDCRALAMDQQLTCTTQPVTIKEEPGTLKVVKHAPPDGICSTNLKRLAGSVAILLTRLLNRSMDESQVYTDWKLSQIAPTHKEGNKRDLSNYRPVILTSVVLRILE